MYLLKRTISRIPYSLFILAVFLFASGLSFVSFSVNTPSAHAASPSYTTVVMADKPVGFWAVNNPSGTEPDLSGNGSVGSYNGGIPTLATMPNGDTAAVFNGSTQYLTIPSSPNFSISTTQKLTWEGWIRPDVLDFPTAKTGYVDWMGKGSQWYHNIEWEARFYNNNSDRPNRSSAYAFNLYPDHAGYGSGADWQPYSKSFYTPGQWIHVVGQYDLSTTPARCNPAYPGSLQIWVNGIRWNDQSHGTTGCMSQYSIKPTAGPSPINIGTMAMDFWFKGAIGKVAIYNYLLSEQQIAAHYTAMTGRIPSGNCNQTATYASGYSGVCTLNGSTTPILSTPVPNTSPRPTAAPSAVVTPTAAPISCPPSGIAGGGVASMTVSFSETGNYKTWINMTGHGDNANTVWMQFDNLFCAKVGDLMGMPSGVATWVDYQNGATGDKIPMPLVTAGTHTIKLIGNKKEPSVAVTRILFTRNTSCTPSGNGDACIGIVSTPTPTTPIPSTTKPNPTVTKSPFATPTRSRAPTPTPKPPVPTIVGTISNGLQVSQKVYSKWDKGYCANLTIKNTNSSVVTSWTITFPVTGKLSTLWSAKWSQTGSNVTAQGLNWNSKIQPGGLLNGVGYCANY